MQRLRLAVDATPLLASPTGVGAFVSGALPALAARDDLDVSAFTLAWRGGGISHRLPAGVAAVSRPAPASLLIRAWSSLDLPPGEWWTGRADVVHGTNFTVPPCRTAAAVVTVHDLTPLRFRDLAAPATQPFPAVVRRALRRGAWVHTPSAFVAAEVVELLGADPERVRAVHHGVPRHVPAEPVERPAEPYVLAIGTVEPRKDLPTLVRAFDAVAAAHPDLHLVLAGPSGWGTGALDAALARASAADRVVRLGYVSAGQRTALLEAAAVLAFPSLYEGFGFPPLEAMGAGVPVVAARAGAVPEVLGDAAMLVAPADADALAEALALVLTDDARRADLIARGRARVEAFSWQRCAEGLAALYRAASGR